MNQPPEPPFSRPVRIWRGLKDPLGYLAYTEEVLGEVVALRQERVYAVFHPDHIKHVLQDNSQNYEKGAMYRAALSPIMGNGIFTSEGPFWLRQRRLAQGAFQKAHMSMFAATIAECADATMQDWAGKAARGEALDLRAELVVATLYTTLRMLFQVKPDMGRLAPAVAEVTEQIHLGAQFLPFHLPKWIETPARRRFAKGMAVIDEFVYGVIAERKAARAPGDDLVSLLLSARDQDTGESMSDLQLRDELVTMLVAGHDTVTDCIVWTLLLLAQHTEIARQTREEIGRVTGPGVLSIESVHQMELLGRVIHESLRIYPPGWAFARTALADDEIGGFRIPKGALVVISPYVMQRSRRFWENPQGFDPDRFLPAQSAGRPRFVYFPFGGGQRQCIGAGLAMLELPLILASILQRFDFEIPDVVAIKPSPRISLRPDRKVWVRFTERV